MKKTEQGKKGFKVVITDLNTNEVLLSDEAVCIIGSISLSDSETRRITFCHTNNLTLAQCLFGVEKEIIRQLDKDPLLGLLLKKLNQMDEESPVSEVADDE